VVELSEIKKFCEGKKIIIIGNSSRILDGTHKKIIDNYEVVVRINRGYKEDSYLYADSIGTKTTILSLGVKSATSAATIIQSNKLKFILCPIIHSENLNYTNSYAINDEAYQTLKNDLGGFKPSTGISTYNFFNRFVNFMRLDLIGFDFFASSVRQRNQLGHCYVEDHHGIKESKYFESSKDPAKTILHEIRGTSANNTVDNIPRIRNTNRNNFTTKQYRR